MTRATRSWRFSHYGFTAASWIRVNYECWLCYTEAAFKIPQILQISQENTCVGVSFLGPKARNFIKKRLQHRCFPVKFAKFLRKPSLTKHLWWLLLVIQIIHSFGFNQFRINGSFFNCFPVFCSNWVRNRLT